MVSLFFYPPEIRKIKCGAEERRRRRLDGGEPKSVPLAQMQTNEGGSPRDANTNPAHCEEYICVRSNNTP